MVVNQGGKHGSVILLVTQTLRIHDLKNKTKKKENNVYSLFCHDPPPAVHPLFKKCR